MANQSFHAASTTRFSHYKTSSWFKRMIASLFLLCFGFSSSFAISSPFQLTADSLLNHKLALYKSSNGKKKFQFEIGDKIEIRTKGKTYRDIVGTLTSIQSQYMVIDQDTVAFININSISHPEKFEKKGFENALEFGAITVAGMGTGVVAAITPITISLALGELSYGALLFAVYGYIPLAIAFGIAGGIWGYKVAYHQRRFKLGKKFMLVVEPGLEGSNKPLANK